MKLRMRANSIRLRLTQSEVRQLAESGRVEETIDFGTGFGGRFVYCLVIDDGKPEVRSAADNGRITVFLPRTLAESWIGTETVGVEADQQTDGGNLRLLIEKDFACLHAAADEDESDAFPNPAKEQ